MGKIKVNENTVKEIDYIPCINCGSDSIDFGDCGYSSFNVAYGKCRNCKHTIEINPCSWNISIEEIVNVWNKSNDPKILREEYRKKIEELQKLIDGLPGGKQSENNIPIFEEIWDNNSEIIGSDISDLEYWADRSVVSKENFFKAMKEAYNLALEDVVENVEMIHYYKTGKIIPTEEYKSLNTEMYGCSKIDKESILKLKV